MRGVGICVPAVVRAVKNPAEPRPSGSENTGMQAPKVPCTERHFFDVQCCWLSRFGCTLLPVGRGLFQ